MFELMAAGKQALLITRPDAGHRVLLPNEITRDPQLMRMAAPTRLIRALGNAAWVRSRHCFMTGYSNGFEDE
jgi:hypothetical protein